jgi:hypothetical protein
MLKIRLPRWPALVLPLYYVSFSLTTVLYSQEDAPAAVIYRLVYLLLVAVSVGNVLLAVGNRFRRVKRPQLLIERIPWMPYFAVVAVTSVSAFYATHRTADLWDANEGLLGYLVVMGLFWIAATQLCREGDLRYFVGACVLCGQIISFWVLQNAWRTGFASRAGLDVNQNYVVEFIAIGIIPLVDVCFRHGKSLITAMALVGILISVYSVQLTGSRGAMAGVVVATILVAWKYMRKAGRKQIVLMFAGIALICAIAFLLPGEESVLDRLVSKSGQPATIEARFVIWPFLVQQLSDRNLSRWLIGDGFTSGASMLRSTFTIAWGDPHNMYLQTLYDQGIIGLGLFLLFLYSIKRRIAQTPGDHQSLFYGWLAYLLVSGLTEVTANDKPFWILLGVIAGSCALGVVPDRPAETAAVSVNNVTASVH